MKKLTLAAAVALSVQLASLSPAVAAPEIGAGLCLINGNPVKFEPTYEFGSRAIIRGSARLDEQAVLLYNFNPFYDIGGRVVLATPSVTATLLSWGTPHSETISRASVSYERRHIECALHQGGARP